MSKRCAWYHCLLTGVAYSLCVSNLFEGFQWGILAWIALLPLHHALLNVTTRQAFFCGWLAGFFTFVGTMYWVVVAIHLYGKVPLPISIAIMFLLTSYLGLFIGIYAWGFVWIEQRWTTVAWILAPCLWVSLEFLRTFAFSGLPWGLLGYSQFKWLPIIQVANITSVYGVSFLIVLGNIALFLLLRWSLANKSSRTPLVQPWIPIATAASIILVVWLYGASQLTTPSSENLNAGIVQANIEQNHKWDTNYRLDTLERYARLTKTVIPDSDFILWPEAATPFLFEHEIGYQSFIVEIIEQAQIPLVFGSPTLRRHDDGKPYLLNSAYILSPSGEITGRYDKQHLVPFGEYIPLKKFLFFLDKFVVGIGDFQPGSGPTLLSIPYDSGQKEARFGVAICYEVIFPNLVRQLVNEGANFLVTITNDAWFGDTVAPYQHFAMVVFRAVENRMAFARAANTGVSGFIDPTGRIHAPVPIFTEESFFGSISLGEPITFYTQFGDVFAWTCVIISLFLLLFARFCRHSTAADTFLRYPTKRQTLKE